MISKHDGNPVFAKASTQPGELTEIIEQHREEGGDRTESNPESTDATEQGRSASNPYLPMPPMKKSGRLI